MHKIACFCCNESVQIRLPFYIQQREVFQHGLLRHTLDVFGLFGREVQRAGGLVGLAVDRGENHVRGQVAAQRPGVETILRIEHVIGPFGTHRRHAMPTGAHHASLS